MDFRNHTPFPAAAFRGLTPDNTSFHVVVLRQTFTLADGSLVLADEQSPLAEEDVFAGEPGQSSLLAESDLCPFKPWCDLLVNATAHAPGGRPAAAFLVRLHVQVPGAAPSDPPLVDKILQVSGPSWIRKRHGLFRLAWWLLKWGTFGIVRRNPWKRTDPGPILRLPIRYEHAYGGEAKVVITDPAARRVKKGAWLPGVTPRDLQATHAATGAAGALAWQASEVNPIGKGFATQWLVRATRRKAFPAPQVQAPSAPFTARHFLRSLQGKAAAEDDPALEPQGFGALGKGWQPRADLLGTIDEAFVQSDRHLPEDFDFAYWNAAPADQRTPFLKGDEVITLVNLSPHDGPGAQRDVQGNTLLRLELPGHQPLLMVRYEEGDMVPMALELDTVIVNPDAASLVLAWRCALPLDPAVRVAEAMVLDAEEQAQVAEIRRWVAHA